MHHVQGTDNEAPGVGDAVGTVGNVPEVPGPDQQVEDRYAVIYASGYADGRADAVDAAAIFLGLNGFHPDQRRWVDRFRRFVKGTG